MFIYKITNLINGKVYIGQTVNKPNDRWNSHCSSKKNAIGKAINKYGRNNFLFETIDTSKSLSDLNQKESFYICLFNSLSPKGYNLHTGGDSHEVSIETKTKMSNSKKGKPSKLKGRALKEQHRQLIIKGLIGREVSNETKLKISQKNKGKKRTDEFKKKMSDLKKGNKNRIGKKHTESSKLKNSLSNKGRVPWNLGRHDLPSSWNKGIRPIIAESINKMVTIEFPTQASLKDAGFNKSHVYEAIRGIYKQYLGFTWRYA